MDIETRGIILSQQRITKALIRRRLICAFVVRLWQKRFCHDVAQLEQYHCYLIRNGIHK